MNFQLPQQDDDFDYYGNSSQDESRDSQGRHYPFFFVGFKDSIPTWMFMLVNDSSIVEV